MGVEQSTGRVGSALDDAVAESFNSTLKTEYVYRRFFPTRADARRDVGAWIGQFYNHRRRHSWCGGVSPIRYEQDQQLRSAA